MLQVKGGCREIDNPKEGGCDRCRSHPPSQLYPEKKKDG